MFLYLKMWMEDGEDANMLSLNVLMEMGRAYFACLLYRNEDSNFSVEPYQRIVETSNARVYRNNRPRKGLPLPRSRPASAQRSSN